MKEAFLRIVLMCRETEEPHVTLGNMRTRLVIWSLVLTSLSALFWLPIPGVKSLKHRILAFGLTECGPAAFVVEGNFANGAYWPTGISVFLLLVVVAGFVWRRFGLARIAAYLSVFLWFFFGFSVSVRGH